jgi:hypothetical protein
LEETDTLPGGACASAGCHSPRAGKILSTPGEFKSREHATGPVPAPYSPPEHATCRPGSFVIGPSGPHAHFVPGGRRAVEPWRPPLPEHVGIVGYHETAKCSRTESGLSPSDRKLMREEDKIASRPRKKARLSSRQAHQLADPRRRSGRTPALPYPPPETKSMVTP